MAARARLNDLLPESRLSILHCLCGGAQRLPVASLQALVQASSDWHQLSAAPEVLPFLTKLRCRLLTPEGPCKRAGTVWPPEEPLEAHRLRESQPLGERDLLTHCLHTCLRRGFAPARELHTALQNVTELERWLVELRAFRARHFQGETGLPSASAPEGASPPPVWCAAACALPGGRICVVGGGCYGHELADAQTNAVEVFWHQPAVHTFDVAAARWSQQPAGGEHPPPAHTYAAAHARIGSHLLIWCGGYYGRAYNTAYALDTESWQWRALRNSSGRAPTERYFSSSFEFGGSLFAWGGRSSRDVYSSDLWRLDPSRVRHGAVHMEEVRTGGEAPGGKFAATLTNCDNRFALLFGGGQWKRGGRFAPDVETFTLDLASFTWARLQLEGRRPAPRCQHSAVNLGGNLVLVLGGYDGSLRRYLGLQDVCVLNVRGLRWMTLGGAGGGGGGSAGGGGGGSAGLKRGARVCLVGLRSELDGLAGTLLRHDASRGRWHVRLDHNHGVSLVRAANLQELPTADATMAEPDRADEDSEGADETERGMDSFVPRMLSPVCERAPGKAHWIEGQFPCARAGVAIADASDASRRLFYLFGGAQYVHQEWYADLYECSLQRESR